MRRHQADSRWHARPTRNGRISTKFPWLTWQVVRISGTASSYGVATCAHLLVLISLAGLVSGCLADWGQVSGNRSSWPAWSEGKSTRCPFPPGATFRPSPLSPIAAVCSGMTRRVMRSGRGAHLAPREVSEAHALRAVVDGGMVIDAPDGKPIRLRYERHVEHPDGNWTWIGRPIGAAARCRGHRHLRRKGRIRLAFRTAKKRRCN